MSECRARYLVRIPDAPSDQWEAAVCIQEHPDLPFIAGTIHDSGDGTRWLEVDGFRTHGVIELRDERDTLKMLRETLAWAGGCAASYAAEYLPVDGVESHLDRIGRLIAEIDRQRPLGTDGKHGDLHTPSCGCEDR